MNKDQVAGAPFELLGVCERCSSYSALTFIVGQVKFNRLRADSVIIDCDGCSDRGPDLLFEFPLSDFTDYSNPCDRIRVPEGVCLEKVFEFVSET